MIIFIFYVIIVYGLSFNESERTFMTDVQEFYIHGLATVTIDMISPQTPVVEIRLLPNYSGDLNDLEKLRKIAKTTEGPDDIYLRCNDTTALDSPELAKFAEVLKHWDADGDDEPDCDHILDEINDALWRSDEEPKVFHRPQSGFFSRAVMALVPKAPERHIVFSFGELRERIGRSMILWSIPMLLAFIGLVLLQNHLMPFMQYSVISGLQEIYTQIGLTSWMIMPAVVLTIIIGAKIAGIGAKDVPSSLSKHTYGFFNKAAVSEEQAFREGSESWSKFGIARSCVAFGLIHQVNLFYPLATIVPLALGGLLLTMIYRHTYRQTHFRRTAVLKASVWHRAYNKIALTAVGISLVAIVGLEALEYFGVFAAVAGIGFVWQRSRQYVGDRRQNTTLEPAMAH